MAGGLGTDLRHAIRIGEIEIRRSIRAILASQRQLMGFILLVLAFTPAAFFFATASYAAGIRYGDGADLAIVTLARAQVTAWIGSMSVLFGLRMIERAGDIDHADLLLTTVRPRAVVTGLIVAEYVRVVGVFGFPLLLGVSAFALGASQPLMIPLVAVGILPILAVALTAGFVMAYLIRLIYGRFGWGELPQTALGLVIIIALLLVVNVYVPEDPTAVLRALEPLSAVPVGPYADILLLASPFAVPLGIESAVAVVLIFGAVPLLLGLSWRLAPAVWYSDPVGDQSTTVEDTSTRVDGTSVPAVLSWTTTTRLVWWLLLRGVRAPSRFVHLLYFVFMTFPIAQFALTNPTSPVLPMFVAVIGAFLAGGTFGLNPLGIEGSMLPTVITTPSPGAPLVRARILAGTAVWFPPTLLGILGFGWYGSLQSFTVGFLVVFAATLTWLSCTLALALGSALPRFEQVRAFGGIEAPTPTTVALLGHSFLLILFAIVGLAFLFAPAIYNRPPVVGPTETLAQIGGLGFWAVSSILIGLICYRYAVRRLNTFTYE